MKDSKQFWDKSAKRYVKSPIKDKATYQKKLAITREYFTPESQVLEFGCGSGGTALLHSPYVKHIIATDISDTMIEFAQQKAVDAGINNVSFQQGTLDSLNLEQERFDAVLGLNVLHLLEDVDGTIKQVHQLLKPGGVFVSSTGLVGQLNMAFRWMIRALQLLGMAPFIARLSKPQLVKSLTEAGFSIEHEWQPNRGSLFIVAKKQ
jgi:ubiquinone/menaquinone biosynthesis C-methylase UbiE